jgi:hypothetical protein
MCSAQPHKPALGDRLLNVPLSPGLSTTAALGVYPMPLVYRSVSLALARHTLLNTWTKTS